MDDSYRTIDREASAEIKVKGSRFIGETRLVQDPDEAVEKLNAIRKREYSATHHCYAYRVGPGDAEQFKYSDDGEPSGTAGKPIFDVLAGKGVTNTLCVVTRYFGGTKLGTGGLVRAYSDAAIAAIDASGVVTRYITDDIRFHVDFTHYDHWQKLVRDIGGSVVDSEFADHVTLVVRIRKGLTAKLTAAFVELTSGKGMFETVID